MEIIRRGEDPKRKVYDAQCSNCKTVVRFNRAEAEYVSSVRNEDALRVRCPVCHCDIWTDV